MGDKGSKSLLSAARERAHLACPKCGCKEVDFVRDPRTGDVAQVLGLKMGRCLGCGEMFEPTPEQAILMAVEDEGETDEVISEDLACPKCGYDLKTLRVGGKCPECGRTILPVSELRFLGTQRRRTDPLFWVFAGVLLASLVLWYFTGNRPREKYGLIASCVMLYSGVASIRSRFALRPFGRWSRRDLKGPAAVVAGYCYVVIGLVMVVATAMSWLGIW